MENVTQHFNNLRPKYQESKTWADQIHEDQDFLLNNWNHAVQMLGSIKAFKELGQCLQGVHVHSKLRNPKSPPNHQITLQDLVDPDALERASSSGKDVSQRFTHRMTDMDAVFDGVAEESYKIMEKFQQSVHLPDSNASDLIGRLMEEIEVLAGKINADYEHVLGLPNTQKSISQASKIAQLHKSNLLPSLAQTNDEINQLLVQSIERKKQAVQSSVQYLQEISIVESKISIVHSKLANLDVDDGDGQVFEVLNFAIRLPSIYGSLLVECVRRQEWAEKMTSDSSSLVEEMATYKEEEAKRRKKWIREMGVLADLGSLDDMALGIEVNVHSQKQKWPKVGRDDIVELIESLRQLGDLDGTLSEIESLFKTLDTPSRQQSRRAKAFKNGSIHEAAFGRTSLLLRGDDQVIMDMKNERSKVEDKLKSAESRVRKLEDLLHRQSQVSSFPRPSSAGLPTSNGPLFERHATSPVTNFSSALSKAREVGPRRSSNSSRRFSMNNELEEKGLAQRIVSLEAELMNERAHSADLAKTAAAHSNTEDLLKSQVREAISTKEDLLGNLEAQQREFDDERRLLHEENNKIRLQLEQLEDEFDRVLDNRENEDKTRILEEELEHVRTDAGNEVERAHHQVKSLRDDCAKQQDQLHELKHELQQQEADKFQLLEDANQLEVRLQNQDMAQAGHDQILRATLGHLSEAESAPEDFGALVEKVEAVCKNSVAYFKDIKDAIESLRADNEALELRIKGQGDETYDLRERLGNEERKIISLHEELSAQQTQCASLQNQLEFERREHDQLKTKFATGETDSTALRAQLTEKESMLADLLGKITQQETHKQELNGQLAKQEAKLHGVLQSHENLLTLQDFQASRAVDISKKFLLQNATLERLLEQISLVVIKEGDKMVIQKAPKATGASTMLSDSSMKRSLSGPLSPKSDQDPAIDPEVLHWAATRDIEETEGRFAKLLTELSRFDTDIFNEAVYKRVKEIEHIARKWQKEARAYRDKSHRAQGEAHDRIALRNFKEGDLALFLPTRDQATKPWAAFNVGAPHCFLREQDSHNLAKRDWLIARISKVEERVVDLSRSISGGTHGSSDQRSGGDKSDSGTFPNNENPYELSDGLRWYLIDAAEEKPGAPINVGTGKVTVASANVDAKGSIRMKKAADGNGATKTLTRSLDSRRSSTNSKKGLVAVTSNSPAGPNTGFDGMLEQSIDNAAAAAAASSNLQIAKDAQQQTQDEDRPRSSQTLDVPIPGGQATERVGNIHVPDW